MIERLVETLRVLAAPPRDQLGAYRSSLERGAWLAGDYADALRLVTDCPQIELLPRQRTVLESLERELESMSARDEAWSSRAVEHGAEWERVRALARRALVLIESPNAE